MNTKATFKPASKQPAKGAAVPPAEPVVKARKTVDPNAVVSRAVAGYRAPEGEDPAPAEDRVEVVVPRAFILTDDGHIAHRYPKGRQFMPRSHAEHPYTLAHGVTLA